MSYLKSRSRRTYVYRIPLDDKAAMIRLRRFERKSDYWITEVPDREVPNVNAVKNWACKFYRSKEQHGDQPGDFTGGTIPGLEEYRHSLDWEPHPETELLEMKPNGKGGSKIRGESFIGTHDPRLSDYVEVDFEVPWTPTQIKNMWNGESVPNKMDYTTDPPMIAATVARQMVREELRDAEQRGFEKVKEALNKYMENCDHDHVVKTGAAIGSVTAYCEDCGKEWMDEIELESEDSLTIVG